MKNLHCLHTLILLTAVVCVVLAAGCQAPTPPPEGALVVPPRPTEIFPTPTSAPTEPAFPLVAAMQDWQILTQVAAGDIVHVQVNPDDTWYIGEAAGMTQAAVNADGLPEVYQRSAPMPDAPLGALIGRIGEGPAFLIGSKLTFTADREGKLAMRINDAFLEDNSDALRVKIVIQYPDGKLLRNGDLSQGGVFWDKKIVGSCAYCELNLLSEIGQPNSLSWRRTQSENDGSAIWVTQKPFADLGGCDHLTLSFSVRVNNQTLPNSGWWSDQNHGNGEYPALIILSFADAADKAFTWSHGFLYQHDGSTHLTNYTQVPQGEWASYEVNLLAPTQWVDANGHPLPTGVVLTEVWVGGSGWDFEGAIQRMELVGCQASGG